MSTFDLDISSIPGNQTLGSLTAACEDQGELAALQSDVAEASEDPYAYDALVSDSAASTDEAEELSDEYVKGEQVLDIAEEAFKEWDAYNATMESFVDAGGIDVKAAMISSQHRSYILRQLGFKVKRGPSFEGYADKGQRQTQTKITLEESEGQFKAVLKKVWEFIKNTVNRVVELVKSWLTATGRAKRRAAALSARAEDAAFSHKLTDAESKRYGRVFWNGSKTISAVDGLKMVKEEMDQLQDDKFPTQTMKVMRDVTAGLDPNRRTSVKQIKDVLFSDIFKKETWTKHVGLVNDYHSKIKLDKDIRKKWDKGDGNYYGASILPGGMRLVFFSSDQKPENIAAGLPGIAADFNRFSPAPETASLPDKQAPGTAKEVKRVCDLVVTICNGREKANQNLKEFATKAKTETEILDKKLQKLAEQASTTSLRQLVFYFRQLFNTVVRPFEAVARYCVSICLQALDLCALKMRSEGKKDD